MRFSVTRSQRDDRVVTLTPAGEVDLGTAGALRDAIQDTLRMPHPVDVVVDLGRVTFLDCAGIGALVAGRNTAVRQGCGYTVVNPQRHVRRVLELTGVHAALTVHPDPAPPTGQPVRSSGSGHRRHHRRVAAGSPAPSTADIVASGMERG